MDAIGRVSPVSIPTPRSDSPCVLGRLARQYGVLIVDDEEFMRRLLSVALRQQGFAVWLAADGEEAADLYERNHETIDVVLIDVRMPRRDGPQTLADLREINPAISCCFMSGDFGGYSEETLRDLSSAAVLRKPFHLDEIGQTLRELTHDRQLVTSSR